MELDEERWRSRSLAKACSSDFSLASMVTPAESRVSAGSYGLGGGGGRTSAGDVAFTVTSLVRKLVLATHPSLTYSQQMNPFYPLQPI